MTVSISHRIGVALVLACLGGILACGGSDDGDAAAEGGKATTWGEIQRLYEKARHSGEAVPGDAYEWVKQDLERVGDWEYRVLAFDSAADAEVEQQLNEMGRERWECFAVVADGSSLRMLFKRPVESYVGTIPHSDLLRLMRREKQDREADAAE